MFVVGLEGFWMSALVPAEGGHRLLELLIEEISGRPFAEFVDGADDPSIDTTARIEAVSGDALSVLVAGEPATPGPREAIRWRVSF